MKYNCYMLISLHLVSCRRVCGICTHNVYIIPSNLLHKYVSVLNVKQFEDLFIKQSCEIFGKFLKVNLFKEW